MAEISSAGINNYVSQQTTQQAAQAAGNDGAQRNKEIVKSPALQRGVIIQISKEGRELAKAAVAADDTQIDSISNRNHQDFQTAIVKAKQRQSELQRNEKQTESVIANQQNNEFPAKDIMVA